MRRMRDRLEAALEAGVQDIRFKGHREKRLPNTASISFLNLEAIRILEEIGREEVFGPVTNQITQKHFQ